ADRQSNEIFDPATILPKFDNDVEFLQDLAGQFFSDCPRLLAEMHKAVANGDGTALEQAAHWIKGAVGNFATSTAFEAAFDLEKLGRAGDLAQAEEAITRLEEELERLKLALAILSDTICAT